jgi:aryl-phospho-beta-D-glucosidase BglC (GH1 family)
VERIEGICTQSQDLGLHVSLNLHRAPGYCINSGFYEPYDLWKSKEAQEAFNFHWGMWGKRLKSVPSSKISFDLLNEPSMRSDLNDQHSKSTLFLVNCIVSSPKVPRRQSAPRTLGTW